MHLAVAATVVAIVLPTLIVHWVAMGYAIFAQCVSVFLWGIAIACWGVADERSRVPWRDLAPLNLALGLTGLGVLATWMAGIGHPGQMIAALGVLAAASFAAATAGRLATGPAGRRAARALLTGVAVAGALGFAIGAVEVFAPAWIDGFWLAPARVGGRANANLFQANHLSLVLVWALLAFAAFGTGGTSGVRVGASLALALGVALTQSRTGAVAIGLVAAWAAADRALPRSFKRCVWVAGAGYVVFAIAWWAGRGVVAGPQGDGVGLARDSARGTIYADSLLLIARNAWTGVGWNEFGLAWSLTPFDGRSARYFDHAHNLVLQLLAELGVPLGGAVVACLAWMLWRAVVGVHRAAAVDRPHAAAALGIVGVAALHSLVEAPMWYAYLLLPTAWAAGLLLACPRRVPAGQVGNAGGSGAKPRLRWALLAGAAVAFAASVVWLDFVRALPAGLTRDRAPEAVARNVSAARQSRLFGYFADYLEVTASKGADLHAFDGARRVVLDAPVLTAWAEALERGGQTDPARHLVQRLREFDAPASREWLAACDLAETARRPAYCGEPSRPVDWREFRRLRP